MKHESDGDTIYKWCARYSYLRIDRGTGVSGNKNLSGNHPNYKIIEIAQNTEKSLRGLCRLVVNQNPVRNHQVTLMKILSKE